MQWRSHWFMEWPNEHFMLFASVNWFQLIMNTIKSELIKKWNSIRWENVYSSKIFCVSNIFCFTKNCRMKETIWYKHMVENKQKNAPEIHFTLAYNNIQIIECAVYNHHFLFPMLYVCSLKIVSWRRHISICRFSSNHLY